MADILDLRDMQMNIPSFGNNHSLIEFEGKGYYT